MVNLVKWEVSIPAVQVVISSALSIVALALLVEMAMHKIASWGVISPTLKTTALNSINLTHPFHLLHLAVHGRLFWRSCDCTSRKSACYRSCCSAQCMKEVKSS